MTLAEAIYQHSLNLPEPAAREALDFIEFLERKAQAQSPRAEESQALNLTPEQQDAYARLSRIRIDWGGRPIPDRNALYDEARGTNG